LPNPFAHPVAAWRELSTALIAYGPPGLFILAALDSAGIPMVGGVDALLIAVSTQSKERAYVAAALAMLGSLIGCSFLFFLARKGGDVFLNKQISSGFGRRLHSWFQQYGLITVFVPALSPIPMPMKIPVFCAGALRVRYEYFLLVLLTARAIRYFGLAYLATHYGAQTFAFVKSHAWQIGGAALMLALVAMLALRLLQKRETSLGIPQ
jgi:membrane protein YqaA with SNARE-associated domain